MKEIERIKHDGAVYALKEQLEILQKQLVNRNWENIKSGQNFVRLDEAIREAESLLLNMRRVFAALQELEPENK